MWNLKYLKGFQWSHLTEKISYERRVKQQKLRLEIAQANKSNEMYLEKVEQSKVISKMEAKKRSKGSKESSDQEPSKLNLDQIRRR